MHPSLRGGSRALFIVAEYAVWLGILIDSYDPRAATAARLVRWPSCGPRRLGIASRRSPQTADRLRSC
jgi:hypothetical protein